MLKLWIYSLNNIYYENQLHSSFYFFYVATTTFVIINMDLLLYVVLVHAGKTYNFRVGLEELAVPLGDHE